MTKRIYIAFLFSIALVLGASTQAVAQDQEQQGNNQQQSSQKQQDGNQPSKEQSQTKKEKTQKSQTEHKQAQQSQAEKAKAETAKTAAASSGTILENQQSSQMLTSSLIGMTVKNGAGKKAVTIGNINDVVLNKNNQVVGVLVGVGGFLGIAETNYGVAWDALKVNEAKGIAVVDITRKQLDQASSYMTLEEQKTKRQQQRAKQKMQQKKQKMQQQKKSPTGATSQ